MLNKYHIRGRGLVLDGFFTSSTNQQYAHLLTFNTASGEVGYFTGSVYGGGGGTGITLINGADNRVITSNNATQLNGETNLTFDGTKLNVSGNVTASTGFYGDLEGTASWARNALTSSYPISVTGSTLGNESLYSTKPLAAKPASDAYASIFFGNNAGNSADKAYGSNFLGYEAGNGAHTASRSNFIGYQSGKNASKANESNFFGNSAGESATDANNSNFFGYQSGYVAASANNSNFFGYYAGGQSTNAYYSNFLGNIAGGNSYFAYNSNFLGNAAGYTSSFANNSNFFGSNAGYYATNANNSNFFGQFSGKYSANASFSTLIGYKAGYISASSIGSNNIIIGNNITTAVANTNRLNIGGVLFGSGMYSTINNEFTSSFSGSAGGRIGINVVNPSYNLEVSGTVAFNNLTNVVQTNIVGYNTTTKQLFYQSPPSPGMTSFELGEGLTDGGNDTVGDGETVSIKNQNLVYGSSAKLSGGTTDITHASITVDTIPVATWGNDGDQAVGQLYITNVISGRFTVNSTAGGSEVATDVFVHWVVTGS